MRILAPVSGTSWRMHPWLAGYEGVLDVEQRLAESRASITDQRDWASHVLSVLLYALGRREITASEADRLAQNHTGVSMAELRLGGTVAPVSGGVTPLGTSAPASDTVMVRGTPTTAPYMVNQRPSAASDTRDAYTRLLDWLRCDNATAPWPWPNSWARNVCYVRNFLLGGVALGTAAFALYLTRAVTD